MAFMAPAAKGVTDDENGLEPWSILRRAAGAHRWCNVRQKIASSNSAVKAAISIASLIEFHSSLLRSSSSQTFVWKHVRFMLSIPTWIIDMSHPLASGVWRQAKPFEPGVDSRGNFNLSMPVMTARAERAGLCDSLRRVYL